MDDSGSEYEFKKNKVLYEINCLSVLALGAM